MKKTILLLFVLPNLSSSTPLPSNLENKQLVMAEEKNDLGNLAPCHYDNVRKYFIESAKRCAARHDKSDWIRCKTYGPGIYSEHLLAMPTKDSRLIYSIPAKEWFEVGLENIDIMKKESLNYNDNWIIHEPYKDYRFNSIIKCDKTTFTDPCFQSNSKKTFFDSQKLSSDTLQIINVPSENFLKNLLINQEQKVCDFDLLFAFVKYCLEYCESKYDGSLKFICEGSYKDLSMSQTYLSGSLGNFYSYYWYKFGLANVNVMDNKNITKRDYSGGSYGAYAYGYASCNNPTPKDQCFDIVFEPL